MLRVRHIQTTTEPVLENGKPVLVDGKPLERAVPVLDEAGREIEIYSIEIPPEVEAEGGDAINAYVAAQREESAPAQTEGATAPAVSTSTGE